MTAPKKPRAARSTSFDASTEAIVLEQKFAMIPPRAFRAKGLGCRDLQVYMAMAVHRDPDRPKSSVYPSFKRLAKIVGIDRTKVPRSIAKLETCDPPLIRKRQHRQNEDGDATSNLYEIIFDDDADAPDLGTPVPEPGNTCSQSREHGVAESGNTGVAESGNTGVPRSGTLTYQPNRPSNQTTEQRVHRAPARSAALARLATKRSRSPVRHRTRARPGKHRRSLPRLLDCRQWQQRSQM